MKLNEGTGRGEALGEDISWEPWKRTYKLQEEQLLKIESSLDWDDRPD